MSKTIPRQYSLVQFTKKFQKILQKQFILKINIAAADEKIKTAELNSVFVFFGEIPNMLEHCIVMHRESQRFLIGYHTEAFEEISEEET